MILYWKYSLLAKLDDESERNKLSSFVGYCISTIMAVYYSLEAVNDVELKVTGCGQEYDNASSVNN